MSKDGFPFATSKYIPEAMDEFENKILKKHTPTTKLKNSDELTEALAIVHIEFILIHPFREGNGRLARVLSDLMILQAGNPNISYQLLTNKKEYISAIHEGQDRNYKKMTKLFKRMLEESLKKKLSSR